MMVAVVLVAAVRLQALATTMKRSGSVGRSARPVMTWLDSPPIGTAFGCAAAVILAATNEEVSDQISRQLTPAALRDIYVRPGASPHGVGLIAIRPVPKGGKVCMCGPTLAQVAPMRSLLFVPRDVRTAFHEMWDGIGRDGTCLVPMRYDLAIPLVAFINHAAEPNCRYDSETNSIRASRRLAKGEEATVDYLVYMDRDSYIHQQAANGFTNLPVTWWWDRTDLPGWLSRIIPFGQ